MLRISALNEEFSEESSGVDEPIIPTKEVEVSCVSKLLATKSYLV